MLRKGPIVEKIHNCIAYIPRAAKEVQRTECEELDQPLARVNDECVQGYVLQHLSPLLGGVAKVGELDDSIERNERKEQVLPRSGLDEPREESSNERALFRVVRTSYPLFIERAWHSRTRPSSVLSLFVPCLDQMTAKKRMDGQAKDAICWKLPTRAKLKR